MFKLRHHSWRLGNIVNTELSIFGVWVFRLGLYSKGFRICLLNQQVQLQWSHAKYGRYLILTTFFGKLIYGQRGAIVKRRMLGTYPDLFTEVYRKPAGADPYGGDW